MFDSSTSQDTNFNMLKFIVSDDGYLNVNPSYEFIGQGFFDLILRKIIFLSTQNISLYQQYNDSFAEQCVRILSQNQQVSIIRNKIRQLHTFLGEMYVLKKFNFLQQLQNELSQLLLQNMAAFQLNDNSVSLIEKQDEEQNQQSTFLVSMVQLLEKKEENKFNAAMQIQIDPKQKMLEKSIDEYLAQITRYRAQLNYLNQHMKIPVPLFIRQRQQDESYIVSAKLEFKSVYLNNRQVYLSESSRGQYCEETTERTCYKIAKRLYMTIPEMWKDFTAIKKKKAIFT